MMRFINQFRTDLTRMYVAHSWFQYKCQRANTSQQSLHRRGGWGSEVCSYAKTGPAWPSDSLVTGCRGWPQHYYTPAEVTWLSHRTDGAGFLIININSALLKTTSMHYWSGFLRRLTLEMQPPLGARACIMNTAERGKPRNLERVRSVRPCCRGLISPSAAPSLSCSSGGNE